MDYANMRCFVITPIGNDGSPIRREIEGVFEVGLKPVLLKLGFTEENIIIPHRMDPGMMILKIINELLNCELVIANLTGNNPNVMYEVGIRHAFELPMIFICNNETKLPFDLQDMTVRFYQNDIADSKFLQMRLEEDIPTALAGKPFSNPVTIAKQIGGK